MEETNTKRASRMTNLRGLISPASSLSRKRISKNFIIPNNKVIPIDTIKTFCMANITQERIYILFLTKKLPFIKRTKNYQGNSSKSKAGGMASRFDEPLDVGSKSKKSNAPKSMVSVWILILSSSSSSSSKRR